MHMCACAYARVHVCAGVQIPVEVRGIRSPSIGVTGGCEVPDVGAGIKSRSSGRAVNALHH